MKKSIFFIIAILLFSLTAYSAVAGNWMIAGGSVGNYSGIQGLNNFYYLYAVNESNLSGYIGNSCGGTAQYYQPNISTCGNPSIANRTDFAPFVNGQYLWWHPTASNGAMIKFVAPASATYYYNATFYKYTGGTSVSFYIKKNGYSGTQLNFTTLSGGQTTHFRGEIELTAGETLVFYNYDTDGTTGDSSGVMLNISGTPTSTTVTEPSWVFPTPVNGGKNNTQVVLNASCDAGNRTYMWFNGNSVLVNATLGNWTTNVTTGGTYSYTAGCWSGGVYSLNVSRTWIYDDVFPVITINPNNEFNANNYTVRNAYDKSVFLNFSFLDDRQLYAYEINISKGGVTYFNETNQTLTTLSYNYSKTINAASWSAGVYDVQLLVSDSHTAKEIPVYDLEKKKSSLKYKTELNNVIEISSDEPSTVDSQKKLDRYDFDFAFDDKKSKDRLFHVKSEKYPIVWIQNSKYKAHFVIYGDKGGNWVDFEGIQGKPIVNKINDKHFTVYFSNVPDKVKFNSIGGLNVYAANFTFYVGNYSFNSPLGTINDYSTLFLNLTKDNTHVNNISANFYYNGTLNTNQSAVNGSNFNYFENSIINPAINTYMPFVWNITVYNLDGSTVNFNVTGNQTVSSFGIVSCGTYTNTTLIITYWNESNPANAINASLEVDLSVFANNPLNRWNYSVTLPVNYTHKFCIFPENINLTGDVYFKYENPTGFIERYFFINHTFTNSVQNLELYNWDTTDLNSLLKLTTRKVSDYGYYKNVVATLQRFYVGEGVWRNVQMDESGDFGGLNFNILEKNTDYRLIFLDRATNSVVKTTQPIKFVCNSGLCDLTYLLNPEAATASNNSFVYSWTYDNSTKILLFNWTDGSGISQDVRMFAWKSTITGTLSVCDSNQTGNAGFYSCNTENYSGVVFVSISNNNNVVVGEYLDLAKTKLGDLLPAGEGAWWALVIMVTVIMFGLFSPIGSIITGILGLIIIFMLGIFSVLTMTGLIIAIVVGVVIGIKVKQ